MIYNFNNHCITVNTIVLQLINNRVTVNITVMRYRVEIFQKKIIKILLLFFLIINISCKHNISPYSEITINSLLASCDKTQLIPVDVVILAGQSNMAGFGLIEESRQYISDNEYQQISKGINDIYIFTCNDFAAKELGITFHPYSKVNFDNGPFTGLFGPEVGFALEYQRTGRKLILIKYTAGGMASEYFIEDNDISRTMKIYILNCCLELIEKGFYPNIRACCWMQGENDCDIFNATQYYGKERLLIKYLRKSFNDKLLFIDARVTDWQLIDPYCYQDVVNEAKEKIAQEDSLCFLIDSTGLIKNGAHYNTLSTIELGRRFAKEFLAHSEVY